MIPRMQARRDWPLLLLLTGLCFFFGGGPLLKGLACRVYLVVFFICLGFLSKSKRKLWCLLQKNGQENGKSESFKASQKQQVYEI